MTDVLISIMANGRKGLGDRESDKRKSYVGAALGGERNGVRYDVPGIRKCDTDLAGRVNLTDGSDRLRSTRLPQDSARWRSICSSGKQRPQNHRCWSHS